LPKFQKESFFKSFILFFITIEILLVFIFYNYSVVEKNHLKNNIFLEMKNYSYNFNNDKFDIDIVSKKTQKLYELQGDNKNLYIFIDIENKNKDLLKIIYPQSEFNNEILDINKKLLFQFITFSIISLFIALLFSYYSLYPLQKSYSILKEFMKDIIHDINTPISTMKLNLSLINIKDDEIKSIEQSIKVLEMLHKNLDNYLKDNTVLIQEYNMKDILNEQINFFRSIYDYIHWDIEISDEIISTDKYMINRVVYNLLNNACKYNISKNGYINIKYKNKILIISNTSHGIKQPSLVFNRFYKEHDRGLGIGLHIVSKILSQLKSKYKLEVNKNNIVTITVTMK